jgi:multidrug efflux pump subunit AcrA (membrane-fusion protein)
MGKIKKILMKKKRLVIALVVVAILLIVLIKNKNNQVESFIVQRSDISQSVILSGKVQTSDRADLGFASAGRLGKIFVKNNQVVQKGAILAQLEIGDLLADLKIKELNSTTSNVSLQSAKENLEKVTMQENTKVESAYRKLLSLDLILVPDSNDYGVTAPAVTGIYNGPEGKYKIIIDKESTTSIDTRVKTLNLENTIKIINEKGSTMLGTRGLYISFPDSDFDSYQDTTWFLDIPNKAGTSYLANYNAYNESINERDLAIKNAQAKYDELLSDEGVSGDSIAQAEIQKIRAEINKNTIRAPFNGKVTNIEKELGENTSVGERVISILGEDKLEVVLQVSELDVSKLVLGSQIKVTLDAFPREDFQGTLNTVNSRETEVDGVPVYEAFVELPSDLRIKTGMSAKGEIILAEKNNVLSIPMYLIGKVGNSNFVEVIGTDGNTSKRSIVLGLVGTDNMVEVVSGVSEGEKILSNSTKK